MRRAKLAVLQTPSWSWAYAYARPAQCLRALAVLPETACGTERGHDFETEATDTGAQIILTNLAEATLRYTAQVLDPTKFSPLFVDALGWLLASYLAGPIIKGDTGAAAGRAAYQTFMAQLGHATRSDANQRQADPWAHERSTPWSR